MYTDYLYQWAKRAGLVTKQDEFGDVYGLDDEVRSSLCSLRLAHKLIKEFASFLFVYYSVENPYSSSLLSQNRRKL
jgi:hypothetical protein